MGQVFTGALGIVTANGSDRPIALMRNISSNENYNRQPIGGLGTIYDKEAPVTKFTATMNADYYLVDWDGGSNRIIGVKRLQIKSYAEFENNVVLDDNGLTVSVFKKYKDGLDSNGNIIANTIPAFILTRVFLNSEGFNLPENAVGSHTQSFMVLDPIVYSHSQLT